VTELFLSYARADDEVPPAARDGVGWVRCFHQYLASELRQRLSKDLRFWRDVNDMEPDATFAREIEEALTRALLMVAVISPNYVERPWCLRELQDFVDRYTGPAAQDRPEQIFKVLKHNVPEDRLPASLRNRGRGYKFFAIDPESGIEQPFFMAGRIRQRFEGEYLDQIATLTDRITARLLRAVREAAPPAAGAVPIAQPIPPTATATPAAAGPAVFVAPPPQGSSTWASYLALTAELAKQATVLPRPGEALPEDAAEYQRALRSALEPAVLAIHLLGESAGITLEGATAPLVHMQAAASLAEMQRRPGLRRLIWLAPGVSARTPAHQAVLDGLRECDPARAPLLPERETIVIDSYDSFLGLVLRALQPPAPPRAEAAPATLPATAASVWVVAAEEDVGLARGDLRRQLKAAGITPELPLPAEKPGPDREAHAAKRESVADAALVLWGSRDVAWVEDQLLRLRGWRALGRDRPFSRITVAVLPPDTAEKQAEDPTGPQEVLLDLRAGLDAAALRGAVA
jgi:hypothetical protein